MASRASKRNRNSMSPTRQDAASLSPMPVGAQIPTQSSTLAMAVEVEKERDITGVHVRQKKKAPNPKISIMSLGLATKDPAERRRRSSPPGFGEFLKVCRWCNRKIGGDSAYMFGNFYAFCKPECREVVISKFYDEHLFESGLADKRMEDVKETNVVAT